MQIGVLLPHFGPESSFERVIEFSPQLEKLGYRSAWVRDNLGFTGGHAFEARGNTFVDPFLTLTAIASRTSSMIMGTATIIPIRPHAITAQLVGSLAYVAQGRLILGVGAGNVPKAFELTSVPYDSRHDLVRDMVGVLRATAEPNAQYVGATVHLTDATIEPSPPRDLEIWYGGSTNQSVDRAVEYCTGWIPGRCPLPVFDEKLARLRRGEEEMGRKLGVGIIPVISLARSREEAVARVNVDGLLAEARARPAWQKAGPFNGAGDLPGLLIAGDASDIIEGLEAFATRGVDVVVLDFRLRMDSYEESVEQLATDVLPHLSTTDSMSRN